MATDTIESLKYDQGQWRKGVELIASALGEQKPPNLSCVRIAELAIDIRLKNERLSEQLYTAITGGDIDAALCDELLADYCKANGIT